MNIRQSVQDVEQFSTTKIHIWIKMSVNDFLKEILERTKKEVLEQTKGMKTE